MLFVIFEVDDGDQTAARNRCRDAHFAYCDAHAGVISAGAGLLDDDDRPQRFGSVLIVDVTDEAAAHKFASDDPFFRANIFKSVTIKKMVPNKWNAHLRKVPS